VRQLLKGRLTSSVSDFEGIAELSRAGQGYRLFLLNHLTLGETCAMIALKRLLGAVTQTLSVYMMHPQVEVKMDFNRVPQEDISTKTISLELKWTPLGIH
jgi:hypothetical protein